MPGTFGNLYPARSWNLKAVQHEKNFSPRCKEQPRPGGQGGGDAPAYGRLLQSVLDGYNANSQSLLGLVAVHCDMHPGYAVPTFCQV